MCSTYYYVNDIRSVIVVAAAAAANTAFVIWVSSDRIGMDHKPSGETASTFLLLLTFFNFCPFFLFFSSSFNIPKEDEEKWAVPLQLHSFLLRSLYALSASPSSFCASVSTTPYVGQPTCRVQLTRNSWWDLVSRDVDLSDLTVLLNICKTVFCYFLTKKKEGTNLI